MPYKKAIPGCQVLVAKNNKIVFNKAYGKIAGKIQRRLL